MPSYVTFKKKQKFGIKKFAMTEYDIVNWYIEERSKVESVEL